MSLGPLEYVVVALEGTQFRGEIAPALREVVDQGVVRVIDLVFVTKNETGDVARTEWGEVDKETANLFAPMVDEVTGLLSDVNIVRISEELDTNSSAALLLLEQIQGDPPARRNRQRRQAPGGGWSGVVGDPRADRGGPRPV